MYSLRPLIRSDFTSNPNPLGQIKIRSDSLVLRDFNNNSLGFYTFTGQHLTWQVQIRKKEILCIDGQEA